MKTVLLDAEENVECGDEAETMESKSFTERVRESALLAGENAKIDVGEQSVSNRILGDKAAGRFDAGGRFRIHVKGNFLALGAGSRGEGF